MLFAKWVLKISDDVKQHCQSDAHLHAVTKRLQHALILQTLISYGLGSNAMVTNTKHYGRKL